MAKEWSAHQLAIFNEVVNGTDNLIVIARAGSGKTSVLVEVIKRLPNKKAKVLAVAFNKKIAKELDDRINKSYITISTLHSLGLSRIRAHFRNIKIVPDKLKYLILSLFEGKISAGDRFLLEKTVNLCKSSIVDTPSKIDELMDNYDIDPIELSREEFVNSVIKLLKLSKNKEQVDYADMIWYNIVYNIPGQLYDIIFIDEIQDLTRSQIHLALSAAKKGAKIIAFGDNFQCIYSWNGVEIDVVDKLKEKISAKVLGLPISYRCPKKVIELAKEYAPDIESAFFAQEGTITNISEDKLIDYVKPGDFVISRTNAPLVKHCMHFLRNGVKSNIAGKDVGSGLLFLLRKSKKKTLPAFVRWLEAWQAGEIKRLKEKNRSPGAILDKCECLLTICEDAKSISDVEETIKNLFEDVDDKDKVVFSSTHGAKGLERDNVFLLRYTFKPNKNQEEKNIMYTAITRTKSNLYWVDKV